MAATSPLSKGVSTTNTHQKSRGNVSREAHTGDTLVEKLFGIIPLLGPFGVSSIQETKAANLGVKPTPGQLPALLQAEARTQTPPHHLEEPSLPSNLH